MANKLVNRSIVLDESHFFERKYRRRIEVEESEDEDDDLPKLYEEFSDKNLKKMTKSKQIKREKKEQDNQSEEYSKDLMDDSESENTSSNTQSNIKKKENEDKKKENIEETREPVDTKENEQQNFELECLFIKIKQAEWNTSFLTLVTIVCSLCSQHYITYYQDYPLYENDKKFFDLSNNICLILGSFAVLLFSKYFYSIKIYFI